MRFSNSDRLLKPIFSKNVIAYAVKNALCDDTTGKIAVFSASPSYEATGLDAIFRAVDFLIAVLGPMITDQMFG